MSAAHDKLISDLVEIVIRENASDLHIMVGHPPAIRSSNFLVPILKIEPLTLADVNGILDHFFNDINKEEFATVKETNFAYAHSTGRRFRCNAYVSMGKPAIAMRLITEEVRSFTELNLPPILEIFAKKQQGFFLVVGPTGSGKSTTLASMLETINRERLEHIITIEDPIEYLFVPKKSLIAQREVKIDTPDFNQALVGVFRQDADIVMIGEMRDKETISTAVTAAETGHLILSTLHTNTAAQTVDRIIDSFPADQQDQIRLQLAGSLLGVFSQRLVPRVSGGLVPAYELLINNTATANLIRERRTHELPSVIETSSEEGMIDLNRCLADLVRRGEITPENAFMYSSNPKVLERLI